MSTVKDKPTVQVTGQDSNIFNLIGVVKQALRRHGTSPEKVQEMVTRTMHAGGYAEALGILGEYANLQ